ncbi:MAG: short-chain dehydrogenase [Cyanobacteria bacterium PR.3.49]|nr:short-chain dehydrogenase [Cyanobacteria bacterium PR.3.49]
MAPDRFSVAGKVVVVTGGLGVLGCQFTLALKEAGARVAVLDTRSDEPTIKRIYGEDLANLHFVKADVTNRTSLEAALEEIKEVWEVPQVLINNAALDSPPNAPSSENGPFESYPENSWDSVMDVNSKGVFLCCQVFGGAMAEAGRGSIINISSIYGMVSPDQRIYEYRAGLGAPFFKPVAYSVSKSGLYMLTRYLATYWAGKGVRVNTITLAGVFNNQDEQFLKGYLARIPIGRMARDDEYNGAIIFLSSDASAYMTGSNLVMDGGWTAW